MDRQITLAQFATALTIDLALIGAVVALGLRHVIGPEMIVGMLGVLAGGRLVAPESAPGMQAALAMVRNRKSEP